MASGCPLALAARKGHVGSEFRSLDKDGQVDLPNGIACHMEEFIEKLFDQFTGSIPLNVVHDCINTVIPHGSNSTTVFESEYGKRDVIHEYIFGNIIRTRSHCDECGGTSDAVGRGNWIEFDTFNYKPSLPTMSLQSLWEQKFDVQERAMKCPRGYEEQERWKDKKRGCQNECCFGQSFLEKEPPVLMIFLRRGWKTRDAAGRVTRQGKDMRPLIFQEHLSFLRSGQYALRGVVQHHGEGLGTGDQGCHYTSLSWLKHNASGQSIYGEFDDAREVVTGTYQEMCNNARRTSACCLIYVREKHWNNDIAHGYERTPYMRGPLSETMARDSPTAHMDIASDSD